MILGPERVVNACSSTLQAHLPTALNALDTAWADGVTLVDPTEYHTYPRGVVLGAPVQIEIFEDPAEPFDFVIDQAAGRITYLVGLTIRVNWINTIGDTAATMTKRMRRYGAAIMTVLMQNPRFSGTDDAIQGVNRCAAHPWWEVDEEGRVLKARATVRAFVRCEEVAA